ncbi:hypothetical protein [Brachybacterium sp. UNK5269]|uniref:hypothetical protein n=1 Tax=Brachybacterium sp. UNK5269 TaxID=3408576 RepID=UPI003BAF1480
MHVFTRKMRDATGKVATYRTNPGTPDKATGHIEPPALPHPDEILTVRWSGYFIPSSSTRPLAEVAAYYAAHPDSEGEPISGDECARVRYSQCGDPDPDPTTGCRGEEHCQAAPHAGGTGWIYGRTARYRDIAHVLYPGGTAPVPVEDASAPGPEAPVQLALFEYLTTA